MELHESKKSCKIADIESFTFGPFTSRFWLMKKHICMLSVKDLTKQAPFYAWDCLTITIRKQGELFLIIRKEEDMINMLKFLIFSLETVDGKRGTSIKLFESIMR